MRIQLGVVLAFFLTAPLANSAEYLYHPSNTVSLGYGLDSTNPANSRPPCITFTERKLSEGVDNVVFKLRFIEDRKTLYKELNISLSASARLSFAGSGSASFSFDEQYSFSSNDLVWIVYGYTDYGRYAADNPTLISGPRSPEELIARGRYADFKTRCGNEFIQQDRRGTWVSATYSASIASETLRQELRSSFSGSGGIGGFDVTAAGSFRSFMERVSKTARINFSLYAMGGDGLSSLSDSSVNYADLNAVAQTIRTYLSGLSSKKAVPFVYYSTPMSIFGYRETDVGSDVATVDIFLGQYYDFARDLETLINKGNRILSLVSTGILDGYFTDGQLKQLTDDLNKLSESRKKLQTVARACMADLSKCVSAAVLRRDVLTIRIPDIHAVNDPVLLRRDAIRQCQYRSVLNLQLLISATYGTSVEYVITADWARIEGFRITVDGIPVQPTITEVKSEQLKELEAMAETEVLKKSIGISVKEAIQPMIAGASEPDKVASKWGVRHMAFSVQKNGPGDSQISFKWHDQLTGEISVLRTLDRIANAVCPDRIP